MKKTILGVIASAVMLTACTTPAIYWENLESQSKQQGVEANITYPYRFGGIDSATNKINDTIRHFYTSWIVENCTSCSIDSAIMILRNEKESDSLISHMEYQLLGEGNFYVKGDTTSVFCSKEYYMGGANYMISKAYINFNSINGDIITPQNIVPNKPKAIELISSYLKTNYPTVDGYSPFFNNINIENPPMPQTIGLDSTGYVFIYNLYEIAPRSTGIIKIKIPYSELK